MRLVALLPHFAGRWRTAMMVLFAFTAILFVAVSAHAAQIGQGGGGGTLGYSCSTTDAPGDHVPGRSCTCTGGENSADCKKMRDEVCQDKHIGVCTGRTGGPVESCECKWKVKTTRPSGTRPAAPAPAKMRAR